MERIYLVSSLGHKGYTKDARRVADRLTEALGGISARDLACAEPYKNRADTEHLIEGLRKAGLEV